MALEKPQLLFAGGRPVHVSAFTHVMITLYQRTDCPFCWKVRLALAELGLGYRSVEIGLGEQHADVVRLSPAGTVPVLRDGDLVVWESGVILDYLDARYSAGSLIPVEAGRQTWTRSLHAYSDKCIGPAIRPLVFEKRAKPPELWDKAIIDASAANWLVCQAWLEDNLQPVWLGDCSLSLGECALAARCGVAEAYGAPVDPAYTRLFDWFQAVKWRPSWEAAYPGFFPAKEQEQTTI